jgi:glycosyltransferase involved in cell wall biosynthesis
MRIALAAHSARRVGGVEQYLASVVPALVRAGHDVSCWFETDDVDHSPILDRGGLVPTWTASREPDHAVPALRAWDPDVIYMHGVADAALEQALLDVAPSVLFAHSYYGTCISGTKTVQTPATRGCTRTFGPSCLLQYYPRRCGGWSPLTMMRRYSLQQARLSRFDAYASIVVASRHMAEEYGRHVAESKVRVVPLPIESPHPVPVRRRRATGWQLLYLGRLEASKGADIALEAAARAAGALLAPVHLQVTGAGSLHDTLAARAVALMRAQPMLQVTFTGWLDAHLVTAALDQSDLLLVPSRWPEPFGMVGVEAGLRGVPSVGFGVGGIPEWLIDGVTGRLVPEGPAATQRFADAIVASLRDESTLARMRDHGRAKAGRFSMDAHLAALLPVLAVAAGLAEPTLAGPAVPVVPVEEAEGALA